MRAYKPDAGQIQFVNQQRVTVALAKSAANQPRSARAHATVFGTPLPELLSYFSAPNIDLMRESAKQDAPSSDNEVTLAIDSRSHILF